MSRLCRLQVPAILFLIITGFYWKLVFTNQYTWLRGPDYADQVLPWYQFEAGEWHAKRIPLWDPYEFGGQSLIGQGQPGVADPLNLPLFLWPLKNRWITQGALHWFYVLPHWLAAMGFYGLCREFGRSKTASVIAGSLYTLGGIGGSLDWPQMMHATVWGPMALMFQFRAMKGIAPLRNGIFSGCLLGLAWLTGHHQVPLYFTLASAAFWIYSWVTSQAPLRPIAARSALAAGMFLFLISAVQTLPAYEYGRSAVRWAGADHPLEWNERVPYFVHQQLSMSPRSLLGVVIPGFDTSYPPTLGLVVILVALFGSIASWQEERATRWMVALASIGFAYSLGANTALQGIVYAVVPLVEKARTPAVAQILFDAGACALFAAGLDRLDVAEWAALRRRIALVFAATGLILIPAGIIFTILRFYGPGSEDRWMFTGWVGLGCWILLRGPLQYARIWLAFLALSEVSGVTSRVWSHNADPKRLQLLEILSRHADVQSYIKLRPGPPRVSVFADELEYSFGDWWGIEAIESQVPSAPMELFRNDVFGRKLKQLLGVRYYLGNRTAPFAQLSQVFVSRAGLKVWEDPDALPRIWTVHQVSKVADLAEARARLTSAEFEPLKAAFVIGPAPKLETCEVDGVNEARYESRAPNRLLIRAELGCKGMVIVPDLFDTGWIARVDGRPERIYEAYGLVRGIVVDSGQHTLELLYRPASVIAGAWLSLTGVILSMLAAWKVRI
jgi:hypothetical protein